MKESFLTELDAIGAPKSVGELDRLGGPWLAERVLSREHSTTGEAPAQRLEVERRFLGALPRRRFDTAYKDDRRVHPRLALVEWDSVPYSVPPELAGCKVTCRVEVDSTELEIWWGGKVMRRHQLCPGATEPVWDGTDRQASEEIALGRSRPAQAPDAPTAPQEGPAPRSVACLDLGEGDYDVDVLDLEERYAGYGPSTGPGVGTGPGAGCGCTGEPR